MADTLSQCFTDARDVANDIPNETTDDGLRIANRLHRELCAEFKIVTDTRYVILDGASREYSLPEDVVAIWNADLILDASGTPIPLDETSVEELNAESAGWRYPQISQATRYYMDVNVSGPVFGTDWIQSGATNPPNSTGIPIIRYIASIDTPLTALSTLPSTLRTSDVYVAGLVAKWTSRRKKPGWQDDVARFETEKMQLESYLVRKQKANPARSRPFFSGGSPTR